MRPTHPPPPPEPPHTTSPLIHSYVRRAEFLKDTEGKDVDVQVVCVVGVALSDWKHDGGRQKSRDSLKVYNTRVVMYNELIKNAKQSYAQFLEANREVGEVRDIIAKIESELSGV